MKRSTSMLMASTKGERLSKLLLLLLHQIMASCRP